MITARQDLTALVGDNLTDRWRSAFTATPRELFIPDRALWVHAQGIKTPIDRATDPDTWMAADRQQFHLTVTRERQWVWLDDPANTVTNLA